MGAAFQGSHVGGWQYLVRATPYHAYRACGFLEQAGGVDSRAVAVEKRAEQAVERLLYAVEPLELHQVVDELAGDLPRVGKQVDQVRLEFPP